MAKQYRPLDDFNETLEDKESEQSVKFDFTYGDETIAEALGGPSIDSKIQEYDLAPPVKSQREQEADQRVKASEYSEALNTYATSNPYNPIISDEFFTTGGLVYNPIEEPSDSENFWNLTFNTANTIHMESLEGQIMQYEFKRHDYEVEASKISNILENEDLNPKEREKLESKLEDLNEDIERKNEQIGNVEEKIEETYADITDKKNQASEYYKAKAQAGQEDEGTGMLNYLGSAESAQDLGGALSDIMYMSAGMALGATAAFAPAVMASTAGPVGPVVGGIMMVGGVVGGAITQYQMRDNESLAEMRSAYKERYDTLSENFRIETGELPSDEEAKIIDAQAKEGLMAMYDQNMVLMASDVAQIAVPMLASSSNLLRLGSVPFRAKKWADTAKRAGKIGLVMGAEATLEGFEEAYQYMTKEQYKLGMYDQFDKSDFGWLKTVANTAHVGDRAVEGMIDMYKHRAGKGLTNNREFRNSTRAGMALGFFMGGAMGFTVQPAIAKSADFTEKQVLSDELESLAAFSNTSWEELLDVEQASNKTEAIVNALEKNGGKNIMRAFRIFKEEQEKVGNPAEIDFDKVESSIKTTVGLYRAFKEKNPNLTNKELLNLTKGYELLKLYEEKAQDKNEKSLETKNKYQKEEGFLNAFQGKFTGLERLQGFKLDIEAIENLLESNKEAIEEAKKLNRYSKTDLERHMLDETKSMLELALARRKEVFEAERVDAGNISLEDIKGFETLEDERIRLASQAAIGSEIQAKYLKELRAPLSNPKTGFNLKNHPFLRDLFETDKKAEEAEKNAADNKKEEEESVATDDSEIEVGDKAWYEGMPFEFLGKVGELFKLKPLAKTGGYPIVVGKAIFKGLRKLVNRKRYEADVEEVVNEGVNENDNTESNEGKESSENINKRKKTNEETKESNKEDDGQKLADPNKEPVVKPEKKLNLNFLETVVGKVTKFFPGIAYKLVDPLVSKKLEKDNAFFHNRSKAEIEALDVEYVLTRSSIPLKHRAAVRKAVEEKNVIGFLSDPENVEAAKEILESIRIKVKLEDEKGKISMSLYPANKRTFENEQDFKFLSQLVGEIIQKSYLKKNSELKLKGSIAHTNFGQFNNQKDENGNDVKNSIPETFRDRFENEKLLFAWQDDDSQMILGKTPIPASFERGGKPGAIYLLYRHKPEGQTQLGTPMKLNSRTLNRLEGSILFHAFQKIVLSRKGQVFQFDSDFTFNNLFKGVSIKQIIDFLIPRTNGVRMDNVSTEADESQREIDLEQAIKSDFEGKNGIRLDTKKGGETRLFFGYNFLGQNTAETFDIAGKVRSVYERVGDNWNKTTSILEEEGFGEYSSEVTLSEEEFLKEISKVFTDFAQENIYHQITGPLLNHSIFDFNGFQGKSEITFFGKEYTEGNTKDSLYSTILIEGKDPVLFTDLEAIGTGDNKRVQINRQVVVDPSDVRVENQVEESKEETEEDNSWLTALQEDKAEFDANKKEPTSEEAAEEEANNEEIDPNAGDEDNLGDVKFDDDEFMMVDEEVDRTLPLINIEEARAYLKRVLGTKVPVHVIEGLLKVGKQGRQAYASFARGIVTLSTMGRQSSEYHEALHAVENVYLNETQRKKLNEEIAKKYGEPTKEELDFIMNERGFTEEEARNYLLSDKRAEEFRAYELKRLNMSDLSDRLKFWYDTLKDYLMVLFKGLHSRRLYYKISQGQYAKNVKTTNLFREEESGVSLETSPQIQALEDAGFNSVDRFNIGKSLLYGFILKSLKTLNQGEETDLVFIRDFLDIKTLLNKNTILGVVRNVQEKPGLTDEQKENLEIIADNIDAFISDDNTGIIIDVLKIASISYNTEEEYKDSVDSMEDLASIKSPFEFSALDSANMSTKLLFEMLPKRNEKQQLVRDPRTRLPIMADGSYVFNKMQQLLVGIDHIYDEEGNFVSGIAQMRDALLRAEGKLPVLNGFVSKILDKLDEKQLSQFYKVLNMQDYSFRTLLTSSYTKPSEIPQEQSTTRKDVRFFDSAVQNLLFRIQDSWLEDYKSKLFRYEENNRVSIKDVEAYKKIIEEARIFAKKYANVSQGITREEVLEFAKDLSGLLDKIGITVPKDGIYTHVVSNPEGFKQGLNSITKRTGKKPGVVAMFLAKKSSTLEENPESFLNIYEKLENKETGLTNEDFNFEAKNTLRDHRSTTRMLAEIAALSEETLLSNTSNIGGKTFWNFSQGNYIFNTIARFTNSGFEIKSRLEDRWAKSSLYLKGLLKENDFGDIALIEDIKDSFKILTFGESRDRDSNKMGKVYKELGDRDFIVNSLNKMFANNEGVVNFPTFADKSVWYMLKGATIIPLKSDYISYDSATNILRIDPTSNDAQTLVDIFSRYIIEEADRIIQAESDLETLDDNQLTKTFHYTKKNKDGSIDRKSGNALKMMIFPQLNNEEILEKLHLKKGGKWLVNKNIVSIKEAAAPYIFSSLEKEIKRSLEQGVENNVFNQNDEGVYSFINGKLDPLASNIRNTYGNPVNLMAALTINTLISNVETTKIFSGDIAYYKSFQDLTKRIVSIIAPGQSLNLLTESFYRAAVVEDYTLNSAELVKNYSSFLQKNLGLSKEQAAGMLKAYNKVNVTDGQAYITLERWRDLMIGLGDIDRKVIEGAYERLNDPKGKPTKEDVALVMAQPLKGMLFSRRNSEVHGKSEQIPTYLKYSQAVLIPAFVENKADIGELLRAMKMNNVDELVFESAIKVGALSPTKIVGEDGKLLKAEKISLNVMTLNNRDWKLQQPLSPHKTNEQLEGSQVKKNILSGIKLLEKYSVPYSYKEGKKWKKGTKEIYGYELVEEFHEVDRALSDYEFSKLSKEWGLKWNPAQETYIIENVEALQEALVKDFSRDEAIPQKILKLLSLKTVKKGNRTIKEFLVDLDNNPFDDVIERKLSSIITKRLVKLAMPGGSYIQTSSFGMTKPKRFTELTKEEQDELRGQMPSYLGLDAAMWDEKTGKAKGAQIFLPNYMKKLIPNNIFHNSEELKKYLQDNRLLEAVGYRIPNQGLSSIDALQVVGFLPQGYGDTVIAYDEITAKTGSDFDIDKMYIMLPSFDYVYEKDENGKNTDVVKGIKYINFDTSKGNILDSIEENKGNKNYSKALKNKKLELYKAILQDKNTFSELINPLDSVIIKNDSMFVRYLEAKKNLTEESIKAVESLYKESNGEYEFDDNFYDEVENILLSNTQNLQWFGFAEQVNIRAIYLGGQLGVGQEARHIVDHAISQHSPNWKQNGLESPYYFGETDLGIGNVTPEGSSDLSQVYVEGKKDLFAIASILSARLDGYVDIAADPAIFYINNNAITANTVAVMDRLGTNPQWTDLFMSLPLNKEFVKITKGIASGNIPSLVVTTNGVKETKKFYKAENYITTRLQQEINNLLSEEYKKEDISDIRAYNLATNKGRVKAARRKMKTIEVMQRATLNEGRTKVSDIYTVEELSRLIDSSMQEVTLNDLYDQLALFQYFMELKAKGTLLNKAVTASTYDTKGARGGFVQAMIFEGLEEALLDPKSALVGFQERFERTMAGKYKQHGPDLLRQLFGDMFLLGNENYRSVLQRIASATRHSREISENEEYIRNLHRDFRSFMYTETEYFKSINIRELLYGKNNLMVRLSKAKQEDSSIKNNPIIKYLSAKGENGRDGFIYITSPSRLSKSGKEKDTLTNGWNDLLNSPNSEIRKLGEDLYKFSIVSSGFRNGSFTFHELVPLEFEMETGIYEQFGRIAKEIKETALPNDETITRFIISQMNNTDVVPEVDGKAEVKQYQSEKGRERGSKDYYIIGIKEDFTYKYLTKPLVKEEGEITQFPEYVPFVTMEEGVYNQRRLYRFEGLKEIKSKDGTISYKPIYGIMNNYNFNNRGIKIYEHIDTTKESALKENNKRSTNAKKIRSPFFTGDKYAAARKALENKIANLVDISVFDIENSNAEAFAIAPWSNELTEIEDVSTAEEQPTMSASKVLDPGYKLQNPIRAYVDSTLKSFSSINEAQKNGVSLEDAVQLAAKANIEVQEEIENLLEDMSYIESMDDNYNLPGYANAVKRAKILLKERAIGFQRIENPDGTDFFINTKTIGSFIEELSPTIQKIDYLEDIKNLLNPYIQNSDYEVVTTVKPEGGLGGVYISEIDTVTNRLEGSTIIMDDTLSKKKNAITLLHEILHAFTSNSVQQDPVLYKKTKALFDIWYSKFEKSESIPTVLKRYITEYKSNPTPETERKVLSEFITYGLTDKSVVTQLKNTLIKPQENKTQLDLFGEKIESAFNKLVEVVLETFGITKANMEVNAYDLLKDTVGEFISQGANLKNDNTYREKTIVSILNSKEKEARHLRKQLKDSSTILGRINEEIKKIC